MKKPNIQWFFGSLAILILTEASLSANPNSTAFTSAANHPTAGAFEFWGEIPLETGGIGPLYAPPIFQWKTTPYSFHEVSGARLSEVITRQDGGSLSLSGGPSLNMPPQALAQDVEISMELLDPSTENRARTAASELDRLLPASNAIELGPEGTRFSQPVELEVPYSIDQLDGTKESDLKLYHWNPAASEWQAVESSKVNTLNKTVTAQLDHFSIYQVLAPQSGPAAGADAGFFFRELYAFPNPSRRGESVTIRTQVGLADSVAIKIYDISGQLVHSANAAAPKVLDDGNGKGLQYTYDYSWDVSGVGSGVYLYVITAKKSGHGDIRKTDKAAVLK